MIRVIIIFANILLGIDNRVMPRQLLQVFRDPFFGNFTITPSDQSPGTAFLSHIDVKSGRRNFAANSESALKSFALRLSEPGALLFFSDLIAAITSSFIVGGMLLTSKSTSASCMSASTVGGGLSNTSLKCSDHLASCSASVVRSLLCLSSIGEFVVPGPSPLEKKNHVKTRDFYLFGGLGGGVQIFIFSRTKKKCAH